MDCWNSEKFVPRNITDMVIGLITLVLATSTNDIHTRTRNMKVFGPFTPILETLLASVKSLFNGVEQYLGYKQLRKINMEHHEAIAYLTKMILLKVPTTYNIIPHGYEEIDKANFIIYRLDEYDPLSEYKWYIPQEIKEGIQLK